MKLLVLASVLACVSAGNLLGDPRGGYLPGDGTFPRDGGYGINTYGRRPLLTIDGHIGPLSLSTGLGLRGLAVAARLNRPRRIYAPAYHYVPTPIVSVVSKPVLVSHNVIAKPLLLAPVVNYVDPVILKK